MSNLVTVLLMTLGLTQGIFIDPPTINTGVGGNANFACSLNGQCLVWEWSGPAVGASRSTRAGSALSISNLTKEDEGEYVCSCNNQHATATLTVRVPPSRAPDYHLTLQEGSTGLIPCRSNPGDPPKPIVWKFEDQLLEGHEQLSNLTIKIQNVRMEDAGTYTCGFDTSSGFIQSNIIVDVERRPSDITFILPREVILHYGDPLNLNCMVTNSSVPVNVSWTVMVGSHTQYFMSSHLNLGPDQVQTGIYRCNAHSVQENLRESQDVHVMVNVWPVFSPARVEKAIVVPAEEGEALGAVEDTVTTAPLIDSTTTISWRRIDNNELVDFGSRLSVKWKGNELKWSIDSATLEDDGQYFMNISNEFGSTVLRVILTVTEIAKQKVTIQILDSPSCQFLDDHTDELAGAIAREYLLCLNDCNRSLMNTLLDSLKVDCKEDEETALISLNIPQKHIKPTLTSISFAIAGKEFTGTILSNSPTVIPPQVDRQPNVVVPIAVTVSLATIVLVALAITLAIIKCKKSGHGVVNPEAPSLGQQEVVTSGYKEVKHEVVPVPPSSPIRPANVPVTPVLVQPQPSQEPAAPLPQSIYIPPSPVPGTRKSPPRQVTTVERPKHLYIRSHSYSHSTRTPPDQKSKP